MPPAVSPEGTTAPSNNPAVEQQDGTDSSQPVPVPESSTALPTAQAEMAELNGNAFGQLQYDPIPHIDSAFRPTGACPTGQPTISPAATSPAVRITPAASAALAANGPAHVRPASHLHCSATPSAWTAA
ncbi:hypothetical protein M422DRAFT_241803 [Sphaerobolus stellatus SS14]|nr:hypothetical protein M422DRAFT_241803 [Sphaerobolus stellatus SS14]